MRKIDTKTEGDKIVIPTIGTLAGWRKATTRRFEKIDQLLFAIIAAVIVSVVAVVIAVVGLFLDQMRYNNAAYREYSEKLEINELLLEQNRKNQEFIIQQQEQILELFNEKSSPVQ